MDPYDGIDLVKWKVAIVALVRQYGRMTSTTTRPPGRPPEHRITLYLTPDEIHEILAQINESPLSLRLRAKVLEACR
jgi:hypothetical protein